MEYFMVASMAGIAGLCLGYEMARLSWQGQLKLEKDRHERTINDYDELKTKARNLEHISGMARKS